MALRTVATNDGALVLQSHPLQERTPARIGVEGAEESARLHLDEPGVPLCVRALRPFEGLIRLPANCVDLSDPSPAS